MRATDPWSAGDLRDEGMCLYATGRFHEAIPTLQTYLEVVGEEAHDAAAVQGVLEHARHRCARRPSL